MSKRAKEEAWKTYPKRPEQRYITAHGTFEFDYDAPNREGFIKGYEQAEKDLGWISVKDRLPEKSGYYITCVERNGKPKYVYADDYFDAKKKEWFYEEKCIADVDYWMEIPKLPEK